MNSLSAFKKLLFSVNCQTTVAYRAIRSFHFHHLWVRHTVNYIIPPHVRVRHIPVGLPPSALCQRSFQSYQNPANSGS